MHLRISLSSFKPVGEPPESSLRSSSGNGTDEYADNHSECHCNFNHDDIQLFRDEKFMETTPMQPFSSALEVPDIVGVAPCAQFCLQG
ncbi:MAG: hypothetical protein ABIS30_06375 [Gallionella sp.]|jgi:hypothetical protein